jgi:hypothetical protein
MQATFKSNDDSQQVMADVSPYMIHDAVGDPYVLPDPSLGLVLNEFLNSVEGRAKVTFISATDVGTLGKVTVGDQEYVIVRPSEAWEGFEVTPKQ